jgi:hypothetical protein
MSLVGNLEDLGLGDILQIVSLSRKSGVLYLRAEPDAEGQRVVGEIIFQNGQVIRASSSDATQNIGDLLLARGYVTEPQIAQALSLQRAGGSKERVGQILIRQLGVSPEKIQDAIRKQTEAIVYSFFRWPRGDFSFELKEADGALDKVDIELRHLVLDAGLNPQFLAMEGTRLKDEARTGRPPDPATVPVAPRPIAAEPAAPPATTAPPEAPAAPPLNGTHAARAVPPAVVPAPPAADDPFADLGLDTTEFAAGTEAGMRAPEGPPAAGGRAGNPDPLPDERASQSAPVPVTSAEAAPAVAPKAVPAASPSAAAPAAPAPGSAPPAPRRHKPGGPTVDLSQELGLTPGQAALGGEKSRGLAMLRAMISELTSPEAHGQITLLILRFAAEMMRRAVLFLVKEDEIVGLGQFGIDLPSDNPDKVVRGICIPRGEASTFGQTLTQRGAYKGPLGDGRWDTQVIETLGGHRPGEVFCAPISSGRTIAALLYADNAPDDTPIGDTEALEIFLHQAGLQMEKALLERRIRELNTPTR